MMNVYENDYLNLQELSDLDTYTKNMKWWSGMPGGFGTNSPKRLVNSFGDGAEIDSNGNVSPIGIKKTYWTAKITARDYSLHTKTEQMPSALANIVPHLRRIFKEEYPTATITNNTFNIAVCNYYTDPDHYIAAHTDDNIWYPKECDEGCAFASLTMYPEGEPADDNDLGRFQIFKDGKWHNLHLHDGDVSIIPGNVKHRVLPHKKSRRQFFKPRINITFRSTFKREDNPLMHIMAVSNHARYYRPPCGLTTSDVMSDTFQDVVGLYNTYLQSIQFPTLKIVYKQTDRKKKRRQMIKELNVKRPTPNMVLETLQLSKKIIRPNISHPRMLP